MQFSLALDRSLQVARDYKIVGFPSFYVIDRSGEITYDGAGAISYSDLEAALQRVTTN